MRLPAFLSLAAALCVAAPAEAQQVAPEDARVHVVDQGDTLWDLARLYLSDPFLWPEIFSANRGVVADPHLIFPSERLIIPGLASGREARSAGAAIGARQPAARTVFYPGGEASAEAQSLVRTTSQEDVPPVPEGTFYAAGILVPDSTVNAVGQLVELLGPTVIPRRAGSQIQPYDRVFMTLNMAAAPGDRLQLLRPGRIVAPYGRVFKSTGIARVISIESGTATVEIERMYDQVAVGDVAVPLPGFTPRVGVEALPSGGLEGLLLELDLPQPVVSREDVAYVNLGAASGVVEGDEFIVYLPQTIAEWGVRPEIEVARVQVVRSEALTSAVRVISMEHPAIEPGLPVRLVAKMP